jgi:2-polyprenyl-3-methyl-5-hydroxy-6-metoxy-1,4-benzoquinol methylase
MHNNMKKIIAHNEAFWDKEAVLQRSWSVPVTKEIIERAKQGQWQIHITKMPLPIDWLPNNVVNKNILCLASAGGQQGPVLAAAGANVTVFDISEKQLEQDRHVAKRDGLKLRT